MKKTGSCFQRALGQAQSGKNFPLCPLIMYIQAHGSVGVKRRDHSPLKRGMLRNTSPAERRSEGRSVIDRRSRNGAAGRTKEQQVQMHGESGQDNLGVTLLHDPSFPLLLSHTSLPLPSLVPRKASPEAHGQCKPSADPQGHTAALSTPQHKRQTACGFSTSLSVPPSQDHLSPTLDQ